MTHPAMPALAAAFLALAAPAGAHAASLDLPGACAVATSTGLHEEGGGFQAGRLEVLVPGLAAVPAPSLRAARLQARAEGGGAIRATQLEQAATAAVAGLLTALAGHREGGCPDAVLQDAGRPLARALQQGGRVGFNWTDVSIRSGSSRLGAHLLSLRLEGDGATAHLTATLQGAVSNGPAAPLLPEALSVRASLPIAELPSLLAASGGPGVPLRLTIEHVDARRGDTTLDGHGEASIAANPADSSGQGHVTAHGFDALMEQAAGMDRIRTALFLVKLVAHRQGDQADWDLVWQGGTLMVNNVPLPLR